MLSTQRRRIPWLAFALAGIILVALSAIYLSSPRLIAYSPSSGEINAASSSPITLTFNEPMNPRSVEVRFHVEPPTEGRFSWEGNTLVFQPAEPWPYQSEVTVRLEGGARSERFLPIFGGMHWTFSTGTARVVYLWPEQGPADLYVRSIEEYRIGRLTDTDYGILDYAIAPDGFSIVYAALRGDGGSDLRLLNTLSGEDELILSCAEDVRCQNLVVSRSEILLYDRITLASSVSGWTAESESSVWAVPLFEDGAPYRISASGHDSSTANPSPAGWAAYYDQTLRAITIVETILEAEPAVLNQIPNDLGLLGSWSPDGLLLYFPAISFIRELDLAPGDASFYSHIYQTALPVGPSVDLSGSLDASVEDSSPAISPDGVWIGFTRKYLQASAWTLGSQLWLMRSDGSNARQLTNDPAFTCSSLEWRFDSAALVYMRINEADYAQQTEIWWVNLASGNPEQLVIGGYLPAWLP
ncbi:MAG: Ig-like domain-containing protein [Anaerolineales bacterium]|nr:Ig-like domain-containing protein [Anaerolineales bacterium]